MKPRQDTPQWTHDPDTGADIWTPAEAPIVPTGCPRLTITELARLAGSIAKVAKACGVSQRAVGYWRSGRTRDVPFRHVATMAALYGCDLAEVIPG